jgi:hypothetical protein
MKRITLLAIAGILLATGCRKIEVDDNGSNNGTGNNTSEDLVLSGKINRDRTLKAGNTYVVKGIAYVVDGAKLTIEPGTVINGEKASRGTLVITRGCQIIASGTAEKPIVFTSGAAEPKRGD